MNIELKKAVGNVIVQALQRSTLRVPFFFQGANPIDLRPFADPNAAIELTNHLLAEIEKIWSAHENQAGTPVAESSPTSLAEV